MQNLNSILNKSEPIKLDPSLPLIFDHEFLGKPNYFFPQHFFSLQFLFQILLFKHFGFKNYFLDLYTRHLKP